MQDQPTAETKPEPVAQQPIMVGSMLPKDDAKATTWLGKIWGFLFFLILAGTVVGIPLWWIWGRSPLRVWIKALLSLILIAILIAII